MDQITHTVRRSMWQEILLQAEESFTKLREDYHSLREHTDQLETILRNCEINFPDFCGW